MHIAAYPSDVVICPPGGKKKEVKKETGLGLTNKKDENFGEWYSEVSLCFILDLKNRIDP